MRSNVFKNKGHLIKAWVVWQVNKWTKIWTKTIYTTCLCTTVNIYFHIFHLKWKQIQIIITTFIPLYSLSFICSQNTIILSILCFISKSLVEVEIYLYDLFTPQDGWNTAKVGIKYQSIRYSQFDNSPSNNWYPTWFIIMVYKQICMLCMSVCVRCIDVCFSFHHI